MSAYTTINITRSKALQLIIEKMGGISDEELEEFIDKILEDKLYNCNIVPDHCDNDDCLLG